MLFPGFAATPRWFIAKLLHNLVQNFGGGLGRQQINWIGNLPGSPAAKARPQGLYVPFIFAKNRYKQNCEIAQFRSATVVERHCLLRRDQFRLRITLPSFGTVLPTLTDIFDPVLLLTFSAFDNVMDMAQQHSASVISLVSEHKKLSAEEVAGHAAAGAKRIAEELCCDLSRQHSARVEALNERDVLRALAIIGGINATITDPASVLRQIVFINYSDIAEALCCVRPKRLSAAHQQSYDEAVEALKRGMTDAEQTLRTDLTTVIHDPQYSLERRRQATEELQELQRNADDRQYGRGTDCVAAREPPGVLEPIVKSLNARLQVGGGAKLRNGLNRVVRRYLRANSVVQQLWATSRPLLPLLAIEWVRDDTALWNFIQAVCHRHKKIYQDGSAYRQSVALHQLAPKIGRDWPATLKHLQKIKAIDPPGDTSVQDALMTKLRKMSSRELREVRDEAKRNKAKATREYRANRWRYKLAGKYRSRKDAREFGSVVTKAWLQ